MSLGAPVNWSNSAPSPAAQPEYFRYQGQSYVRTGNGEILAHSSYMERAAEQNIQARIDAARRFDPSEPSRQAARAVEQSAQQYRSPVSGQVVPRDQYFAEYSRLHAQARESYGRVAQQQAANVANAWDTPLPSGVTVDMLPTVNGSFAAGPISQGGAIAPVGQRGGGLGRAPGLKSANPGQALNARIRIPRPSPTALARGGLDYGIGLAGEAAIDAFYDRVAPGARERYAERVRDPRSWRPTPAEFSTAAGGLMSGPLGPIGVGVAATTRYLLPDEVDPGNPNAVLGRAFRRLLGISEYPNQINPDALGQGPKTSEGTPGTVATGSVAGVLYRLEFSAVEGGAPTTREFGLGGPVSAQVVTDSPFGGYRETLVFSHDSSVSGATSSNPLSLVRAFTSQFGSEIVSGGTYTLTRADGGQDPVIGNVPPTYAPNPARRPPASSPAPRTLPPPIETPQPGLQPTGATNPNGAPAYAPGPHPWPGSDPAYRPEPSIAPTPAAPPNFQPSELGESAPTFDPGRDIASQPNLENPLPTPQPLQDNPGTPEATEPGQKLGGWVMNGKRMPANTPFVWGDTLRREGGWQTADGQPVTDEAIEDYLKGRNPSGIPGVNPAQPERPQVPMIVPLPMNQPAITPRNPAQPFPPPATTPQTPTTPNPNIDPTPPPRPPNTPNPNPRATCQYERARVMDIQNKSTNTNQRASNPTSGFPGLYGLQIESRVKQGQIFDLVTSTKEFMQKAWEMTRIQKVLDVLTFIGVMHNVGMLSRDVGETFFQLVTSSFQAVGIRDEEGGVIDVQEVVGDATESFLRRILTDQVYDGLNEAWNKANRIISSASAVIWSIRSMSDASLDLLEWVGEHTGRIGNALKRWGVVGERAYPWMSEKPRAFPKGRRWLDRASQTLETVEDHISVFQQAASSVIEVQEEIQETGENIDRFTASILDAVPDPWADNNPILSRFTDDKAASDAPNVAPADAQQGVAP